MKKAPQGRPTKYTPEHDDQVFKLCLLGATDAEIARFFDVVEQTVNGWKKAHPSFLESMAAGKEKADAEVAHSLFKRATGYVGKKTVTACIDGTVSDIREVDDHVGPDTQAASLWLRNRQPSKWRDKQSIEHSGPDGGPMEVKQIIINGK